MKRFSFLLGVALLTFAVGVTLPLCSSHILRLWRAEQDFSQHIRLKLQRLEKVGERYEMQFQVVNDSSDPLRYRSYGKDDHCAFLLWRPDQAVKQMSCGCGNGLAERTLNPGEAATYRIGLHEGFGKVRIGFDFLVGRDRRKETVWSEAMSLP